MEAKELRRIARENLQGNYWVSVAVALVAGLLGGAIAGGSISFTVDEDLMYYLPRFVQTVLGSLAGIGTGLSLVQFLAGGTVQLGYAKYLLSQHNRTERDFSDLLSEINRFGQGFLQSFLRGLYIILWGLLLIIPGIIKALAYSMTPFIMSENPEMTASEAITASKELMDGHKWDLFCLALSFIGWDLLCVLTLGIGNIFLRPYREAAYAAFYCSIRQPKFYQLEEATTVIE